MTGRRIGAVLIAVALIAGALLLRRGVLDDDTDAAPDGTTSDTRPATDATQLVCITELRAVCDAIASEHPQVRVSVEAAGATVDRLAALPDDEPAPMWVTIQPFPAMVDSLRNAARLEPFEPSIDPVASSRLAVAAPTDGRADALVTSCAGGPLWRCIGERAGDPWTELGGEATSGRLRPSLGAADREAVALASVAAAVAGYLGTGDVSRSAWEADPSFTAWFNALVRAVSTSVLSAGTPLATMAARGSALDLAATTDAELNQLGAERFAVNYPEPSMWVEAVLAVPGGTAAPEGMLEQLIADAGAAGWDAPTSAAGSLPGAPTMLALRALWQESA